MQRLPTPWQLAALGPVLCSYPASAGSELDGWHRAAWASVCTGIDSDCLRETVCFHDRQGNCCWRLHLLPDTCFLAWEELVAGMPVQMEASRNDGVGQRLWARLARTLQGGPWQARVLRFHAYESGCSAMARLTATLTTLPTLGEATARHLARMDGARINRLQPEEQWQ